MIVRTRYFALFAAICIIPKIEGFVDGDVNIFDMDLFRAANKNFKDRDVLISPISLRIALGMVLEGSKDETAVEIRSALRLPDDPILMRQETKKWISMLKVDDDMMNTTLKTANRIFPDRSYKIKEDYRRTLEEVYNADVHEIDKSQPQQSADDINSWVKENTNGMIPTIVEKDDIGPDFVLAEVNTVYFKGTWKYQFVKEMTQLDCFYKDGNDCVRTKIMNTSIESLPHAYVRELDAEVVDLPYDDKKHSMLIVLPEKRNGINELLEKIKSYKIADITAKLNGKRAIVRIPKFVSNYKSNMVSALRSLNIKRMFDPFSAQLYGIVSKHVYVSDVIHSAKIEVNEEGSEAAAATIVEYYGVSLNKPVISWIHFTADHPFLYFLKDVSTNAVLFAGKYTGPTQVKISMDLVPNLLLILWTLLSYFMDIHKFYGHP